MNSTEKKSPTSPVVPSDLDFMLLSIIVNRYRKSLTLEIDRACDLSPQEIPRNVSLPHSYLTSCYDDKTSLRARIQPSIP